MLGLMCGVAAICSTQAARADDSPAKPSADEPEQDGDESKIIVSTTGYASLVDARLLDEAIKDAYEGSKGFRRIFGWSRITAGTALVGLGIWRLVGKNEDDNEFQRGLGIMFLSLGGTNLGEGIAIIARGVQEEDRYRRWRSANERGLGVRELARFEGELRAMAHVRKRERKLQRGLGLGRALAGALLLSLVPVPSLNKASRQAAYIPGSVFVGTGLLQFGLSYRTSSSERAWEEYEAKVGLKGAWLPKPSFGKGTITGVWSGSF
ncbi:MAG: hypothetical protein WCE62_18750 [Polyangiales bacterium]